MSGETIGWAGSMCKPSLVCLVRVILVAFAVACCGVGASGSASAQVAAGNVVLRKVVLTERLNRSFGRELLSFPVESTGEGCLVQNVIARGPRDVVPVQISEPIYWPGAGGFLRSGRASFVVDELKPLTSDEYSIECGSARPDAAGGVTASITGNVIRLSTGQVQVELPLGSEQAPSPAAPGAPVPIRWRQGELVGEGAFTGAARAVSWSSRLIESGPVFAKAVSTFRLADGNAVSLSATVLSDDQTVHWELTAEKDDPGVGIDFRVSRLGKSLKASGVRGFGYWYGRNERNVPLLTSSKPATLLGPDTSILPNACPECNWAVKVTSEGQDALRVASEDPGAWVDPTPGLSYGGMPSWSHAMIGRAWENWRKKLIPIFSEADGSLRLSVSSARGTRRWSTGPGEPSVGGKLDKIKDMVLDWSSGDAAPSPRLFLSKGDIEAAWQRAALDPRLKAELDKRGDAAGIARLLALPRDQRSPQEVNAAVKVVRDQLAALDSFDILRRAASLITMYDLLIDSDLITAQDRRLFRAQAAYWAYQLADPQTWSNERGYHSGNPNMSVSYVLSLGLLACALPGHPMAGAWAQYAASWMSYWLATEVGENGEWMPEASHYSTVSIEPMLGFALAAKRAGVADFTTDTRFMKLVEHQARTLTPPDPARRGVRATGAWGRGMSGEVLVGAGFGAFLFEAANPKLAANLQWVWAQGGYSYVEGHGIAPGLLAYLVDKSRPETRPNWQSELYRGLGAQLRAHYGTAQESSMLVLSEVDLPRKLDVWSTEVGGISQWFGRGGPLSTPFNMEGGYGERHELLRDGVRLARNWGAPDDPKQPFGHYTQQTGGEAAFLPGADYIRSAYTHAGADDRAWFPRAAPPAFPKVVPAAGGRLEWTRQLLFAKDASPSGPAYVVVRDTIAGGEPTQWQFRILSEKIGRPDETKDLEAFLRDKPGQQPVAARELPRGDRYTAVGQFGVDLELFVASPSDTPRHTLRYGGKDLRGVQEFQDLFMLQRNADAGSYYLVLFPRPRAEEPPVFQALGGGNLLKVVHSHGVDYAVLAPEPVSVAGETVAVEASAALIQRRTSETVLSLGSAGSVQLESLRLSAPVAASAIFRERRISVDVARADGDVTLRIGAPAGYRLQGDGRARVAFESGVYSVTLAAGIRSAELVAGN